MSVITLAYMGDALYEVKVREKVIEDEPGQKVQQQHRSAIRFVCAAAQAKAVKTMMAEEWLSEEETQIVKRGRNRASNPTKNADLQDYRYATGFEALIGWLFFYERQVRMEEVIDRAIEILK